MRVRAAVPVIACLALGLLAGCREEGELFMPAFPQDAGSTAGWVDVDLGPTALWFARGFIPADDPEAEQVKRILMGVKRVRVRSYQSPSGTPIAPSQVAALREQLTGGGWRRLVQVHDQRKGEEVEVYLAQDEHAVRGLAVIAAEAHELTLVNIVGAVDPKDVERLRAIAEHARETGVRGQVSFE